MKYILTCVLRKLLNRSLNLLPSKSYISLAQWLPISYAITSFFFFFLYDDNVVVAVFKYDPPTNDSIIPHSVYLLPNLWSFSTCDLRRATMVANVTQGGGEGFEFVLKKWQPYYFACGERDGYHCNAGQMKFFVMPLFHQWH